MFHPTYTVRNGYLVDVLLVLSAGPGSPNLTVSPPPVTQGAVIDPSTMCPSSPLLRPPVRQPLSGYFPPP